MTDTSRADVVSSFTVIKGALIDETYSAFSQWDLKASKEANLTRLREANTIGASSDNWLRDVAKVLNRRFDTDGRDRPLVVLARRGCPLELWKPLLLWHMTRDEFLVRDFLVNWLFDQYTEGAYRLRTDDLLPYLLALPERAKTEHAWSESTLNRVASGLLRMGVDFGVLAGTQVREFASYHLPDLSFLYVLHAMAEEEPNARRIVETLDWRMYMMEPADVERELLRLHQYREVDYQVAGSLAQLALPYDSLLAYAEGVQV